MLNGTTAFSGYLDERHPEGEGVLRGHPRAERDRRERRPQPEFPNGHTVFIYPKGDNHEPATYTTLNFEVEDIEAAVDDLVAKGVTFERYPEMSGQDERGIMRDEGPAIAWFKDPAGNILSLIKTS